LCKQVDSLFKYSYSNYLSAWLYNQLFLHLFHASSIEISQQLACSRRLRPAQLLPAGHHCSVWGLRLFRRNSKCFFYIHLQWLFSYHLLQSRLSNQMDRAGNNSDDEDAGFRRPGYNKPHDSDTESVVSEFSEDSRVYSAPTRYCTANSFWCFLFLLVSGWFQSFVRSLCGFLLCCLNNLILYSTVQRRKEERLQPANQLPPLRHLLPGEIVLLCLLAKSVEVLICFPSIHLCSVLLGQVQCRLLLPPTRYVKKVTLF